MISLILVALVVVVGAIWKIKHSQSFWQRMAVKYIPPTFLAGNLQLIPTRSMYEQFKMIYDEFPEERFYGVYQFLTPIFFIKDLELLKQILVRDFDSFMDHQGFVDAEHDVLWGKNLFASKGETWRKLRATLTPTFTCSKMRFMYELMEECSLQFVSYLNEHDKGDVQEWEVKDIFSRYTNDVIASAAFGLKTDSLKETKNGFFLMGKKATQFGNKEKFKFMLYTISPWFFKFLKISFVPVDVANYFYNTVADTVRVREENNIIRPDVIHLLMQARNKQLVDNPKSTEMDIMDITAQAFIFLFTGFETVSTLMSFMFYELALNPHIQANLRKEIQKVWNEKGKVSYEDLVGMRYMDRVLNEALRKWPPVPAVDRKCIRPFTVSPLKTGEKELHLEAGQVIWFSPLGIQRDPKYYPDPMKFDPERFNEKNRHNIDPYTFLPFGAGPRNCIGSRFAVLEAKLLTFHILKEYEIVPVKKTKVPIVLDRHQANLTAKGGMWLGFKKVIPAEASCSSA